MCFTLLKAGGGGGGGEGGRGEGGRGKGGAMTFKNVFEASFLRLWKKKNTTRKKSRHAKFQWGFRAT